MTARKISMALLSAYKSVPVYTLKAENDKFNTSGAETETFKYVYAMAADSLACLVARESLTMAFTIVN